MKVFQYYQPNSKDIKDEMNDCVIRSLTKVTGMTWGEVFDELTPIAREHQCMPNCYLAYEEFLINHGFTYEGVSNRKGTKRPTVASFTRNHKSGAYILRAAHHLVASVDGKFYDTWDSGEKCLYGIWKKEDTN